MYIGDRVGEFELSKAGALPAYRGFDLYINKRTGSVELISFLSSSGKWRKPTRMNARCTGWHLGEHYADGRWEKSAAPAKSCTCGFYSCKEVDDAKSAAHELTNSDLDDRYSKAYPGVVVAEVALWGKVQEHDLGYRSQNMRITKIISAPKGYKRRLEAALKSGDLTDI